MDCCHSYGGAFWAARSFNFLSILHQPWQFCICFLILLLGIKISTVAMSLCNMIRMFDSLLAADSLVVEILVKVKVKVKVIILYISCSC